MSEYELQIVCLDWLRSVYPNVIYRSDLAGVRVPIGLAVKIKASQKFRGYPDVSLDHPAFGYSGMKVELKREGDVFTKSGALVSANKIHHIEQAAILIQLAERGYCVDLAIGFDQFQRSIEAYMSGTLEPLGFGNVARIVDLATDDDIQTTLLQSSGFMADSIEFMVNNYRRH